MFGGDFLDALTLFELNILLKINDFLSCPFLDTLFKIITVSGNGGGIWIFVTLVMLCIKRTRKVGFALALGLIMCLVFNNFGLKNLFARLRPFQIDPAIELVIPTPSEFSFPSGHSVSSFCAATVMLLRCNKKIAVPALVWAVLIGFSRIYFRVHFVSDVIGGAVLGCALGLFAVWIVDRLYKAYYERKKSATKENVN